MNPLINLLPWRQRRRQWRLRFWLGAVVASVLAALFVCAAWMGGACWRLDVLRVHASRLASSQAALQDVYLRGQQLLQQDDRLRRRHQIQIARQKSIGRWHRILTELPNSLSDTSWLSSFALQKEHAVIQGVVSDTRDLAALENTLRTLNGVESVHAGSLKHEPHKGMAFTFSLRLSEISDALIP